MLSGIASSLAVGYKPFSNFDYAVLESDEAYLTKLYDYLNPDYLIVTNLFRDQLDRYGELDTTAKKIQEAVAKKHVLKSLVNADDPMLSEIGKNNKRIYFGFDEITYKTSMQESQAPAESVYCPCGADLSYEKDITHISEDIIVKTAQEQGLNPTIRVMPLYMTIFPRFILNILKTDRKRKTILNLI